MEIEAKFSLPTVAALELLESVRDLASYRLAPGERRVDRDTFLDTADRRFLEAGYYLRRRETDGGVRLTLKQLASDPSGVLRREELEALVAVDVPPAEWPAGELRDRVRAISGNEPLEPFLGLSQERLTRRVFDGDREVAELSLDQVLLDGAGGGWFEAELELRADGDEEDLDRLTVGLASVVPLVPESRSKFARALDVAMNGSGAAGAVEGTATWALFSREEQALHEEEARKTGSRGRRALALLALNEGLTQIEAGRRAGLSDRRVRYWLARYRAEGVAIYGLLLHENAVALAGPTIMREEPATAERRAAGADESAADGAAEPGSAEPKSAMDAAAQAAGGDEAAGAGDEIVVATPPDAASQEAAGTDVPVVHAPRKKRPDIEPGNTMTAAAVSTLRFHLEKMLEHEEGTRRDEDIEELHDMRVSTRRMRMALRVFADYLDRDTMRPVLKGLRRTGATLGAVRDLDVFNEKTAHYLATLPADQSGELNGLMEAWRVERERQVENLVAYLDGGRYRRFVEETTELLDGPLERLVPQTTSGPRPQRVSQVLPGILYKDMGAVWSFEGQIEGLKTPLVTYHALRKACKGLRYTLEFFEGVLGSGAKPLIRTVKSMQDHLGDLQDAVVTCGVLRDYITWGEWRHEEHDLPEPTELIVAPGAARYLLARQEEMERLVVTFPDVWPTVAGVDFSRDLAAVIAEI